MCFGEAPHLRGCELDITLDVRVDVTLTLEEAAKGPGPGRVAAASALPWVPWEKRTALFNGLVARASHDELGPLSGRTPD